MNFRLVLAWLALPAALAARTSRIRWDNCLTVGLMTAPTVATQDMVDVTMDRYEDTVPCSESSASMPSTAEELSEAMNTE